MNTARTSTDLFAILAVAQANWPHDPVAGSEAVWRKWSGQLVPYSFDEVATALDSLARTHPRVPSLAELLRELGARRAPTRRHVPSESLSSDQDQDRWPPVLLDADYVIGPYSLAFAEMNIAQGWTTERLVECVRVALDFTADPAKAARRYPSLPAGARRARTTATGTRADLHPRGPRRKEGTAPPSAFVIGR